ncbi:mannosyltransferase [Winogradskyella pulchriflava]|uniref:Mannosyltransferase n=1 Tax=Winogradskyella pulchriflava TaxID=1110688 RepID=A0ABV6Q6J7_9FLAO
MLGLTNFIKYHKTPLLFIVLSSIFYLSFAYDLVRTDVTKLLLLYAGLFVFAFQIIKTTGFYTSTTRSTSFRLLVIAAILFRLLFLFAIPNLSQDFYRFIWDGQMILAGFNPYLTTPDFQMEMGMLSNFPNQVELYEGMGALSASHYTNYPPLNQLCFVLANLFPGKSILSSVIGMRLLIIAADIGTLYFGKKLLERLKLPSNRIFWYILNPFIIIELTGNIHFEGVMIFFLVWSLYLLHSGKWKWAAVVLACSISVKLIPLMFLPLFFWWFTTERKDASTELSMTTLFKFYIIVGIITILLFLPFFSMEFVTNYSETVGLWFGNFEFNASIYYLARAIGYAITGFNEIAVIGKILPVISLLIILGFSFLKKNTTIPELTTSILLAFSCYLFLSTTVHPWYIATLVMLCIFTNYRFPLVWSLVVVLSYLAYSNASNSENPWLIILEYGIVYSVFFWELFQKKRPSIN